MPKSFTGRKRARKYLGRIRTVLPVPNLIEVQRHSYDQFLQAGIPVEKRRDVGLQAVFRATFPIKDFAGKSELEFISYEIDEPQYDVEECKRRSMTFIAPLKASLRLIVWDFDEDTGTRSVRDIKEQDVYMGDLPLMTGDGTFVINGTERVVVSQMHRSPGVFFDHDRGKTHSSGKYLFSARVIPYGGSWLDFEFDARDILSARIDRRRKLPITTLLYALDSAESARVRAKSAAADLAVDPEAMTGMSSQDILQEFYDQVVYTRDAQGWTAAFQPEQWVGIKLDTDLIEADGGGVLVEAGGKLTARAARKLVESGVSRVRVCEDELVGRYVAVDLSNPETGEVYIEAGEELTDDILGTLIENGVVDVPTLLINDAVAGGYIRNTMKTDKNSSRKQALIDIYRVMRPGEPPTLEASDKLFQGLFFHSERYDLSAVGRVKMNSRLGISMDEVPDSVRVLRRDDVLLVVKKLIALRDGQGSIDDIDHLGNRRVRSVGELLENQYRVGFMRTERAIRERMSSVDIATIMPHDLINAKPLVAAVREFFSSSQLSQFMDQTNPLAEVTHKRRLSALGPGGLTRDRAGFEVRDVHPTHYGRICPIETPEGQNIGLINSLATYARINAYGFIETPYRKVVDGRVSDEVAYVSAMEESEYTVAEANSNIDGQGALTEALVSCRAQGEYALSSPADVDYIDVSPKQLVSVAAALIPFLENDDAKRALMGSNMQRQAVPLVRSEAPFVGTGMEATVARDAGAAIAARRSGMVQQVDATRIVISASEETDPSRSGVDIYRLRKFQRSNQSTCINQRPLVMVGDVVREGDIIADGPSTDLGELALGRNVLVAFMPWNGYNFEDSILISERVVRDDVFTSIHIEEFDVMARDTKMGQEEITRDIPNVSEDALANLDETGIVYIGAKVNAGDVLVGKVTPKGEVVVTPEEKLLRAIFGEKASDVRNTSMRLPPGVSGTVVDVRVFNRHGVDKDERTLAIERLEIERLAKDRDDERAILDGSFASRLKKRLLGQRAVAAPKGFVIGAVITEETLDACKLGQTLLFAVEEDAAQSDIEEMVRIHQDSIQQLLSRFENKVEKLQRSDELPPSVLKVVKVFIAVKRKLQPGDKMAGRHGNKGVISRIVPIEDMPYLEDGTLIDIVLNPLGVPSRMNVGQILETHLGWACRGLGQRIGDVVDGVTAGRKTIDELRGELRAVYGDECFASDVAPLEDADVMVLSNNLRDGVPVATPVFDGANEADITSHLEGAALHTSGQVTLYDGLTGEPFDRKITVGYIYMLKLHHLVDDKIHARSIGPYSLVTQQPLGGKVQFGGQRFGEMEVWALEAYGAAYTLQEMLTVKSDDVAGRTRVYEAIVRGDGTFETGVPESFNVLVKEMQSLGLDVELLQSES